MGRCGSLWVVPGFSNYANVTDRAEELITYFLPTDNINLDDLFCFFLLAQFLFLLHLMRHCNAISVASIASISTFNCATAFTNAACSFNRQLRTLVALITVVFTLGLKLGVPNGNRTAASKVWHFH